MRSSDQPEIPVNVDNCSWGSYSPGDGVDAVTGYTMPTALMPFQIDPSDSISPTIRYHLVQSEADYSTAFSVEVGGTYNMGSVSASASAAFSTASAFSDTAMSIIAVCDVGTTQIKLPSGLQPTPEALEIYRTDRKAFREFFGDYFVEAAHFGAKLYVIYTCIASNSESLIELKNEVSVQTDLFDANGAMAFSQSAKTHNVELRVAWFAEGIGVAPTDPALDPAGVVTLIEWFKTRDNLTLVPQLARLTHYSTLDFFSEVPREKIDPEIYLEMDDLRARIAALAGRTNSLPAYYLDLPDETFGPLGIAVSNLAAEYSALAPGLPAATLTRQELARKTRGLEAIIQPMCQLVDFYKALRTAPPPESAEGRETSTFGFCDNFANTVPLPVISEPADLVRYNHDLGHVYCWISHPWDYEDGPKSQFGNRLHVGWEVHSLKSHNGRWLKRDSRAFIGERSLFLELKSDGAKQLHWNFVAHTVDLASFPWVTGIDTRNNSSA